MKNKQDLWLTPDGFYDFAVPGGIRFLKGILTLGPDGRVWHGKQIVFKLSAYPGVRGWWG